MGDRRGTPSVFHFLSLGRQTEAFVKMRMKHLDALLVERANEFFALVPFVLFAGLQRLAPTANYENIRFMISPSVDQTVLESGSAGDRRLGSAANGQRHFQNLSHSRSRSYASHEISAIH
jgi:hypothetical protein